MFGLKGRDVFNRPTSDIGIIIKKMREFWIKAFPIVFGLLAFYVVIIISQMWYSYLHKKNVTEEEKQLYINKQMNEVVFKKKDFDILKDIIIKRQKLFEKQRSNYKNIFYEYEFLHKESVENFKKNNMVR